MTLEAWLEPNGVFDWIVLIVMGVFWFVLTVFILCLMEVCVLFFFSFAEVHGVILELMLLGGECFH